MNILNKPFNLLNKKPHPKVAMFMCINNEERFLEANLRYHRALGVSRAYVFLDRCEDTSLQIAQSFPWVKPVIVDDRLHAISPFYSELFRVCADHARRMAQAEGFDWLICFDADEFVFINHESTIGDTDFDLTDIPLETILRTGHLPSMLSTVSRKTEAIFLENWNVVPGKAGREASPWQQQFFHFKHQLPQPQTMCDPLTGQTLEWAGTLASRGKSIVRTNADIQCLDSHMWVRSQAFNYPQRPAKIPIPTKKHGFLYHFYITDSRHWREKYQKLSRELTLWQSGSPVNFPKQCGKRASAVLTTEEIDIFLNEWVYLPADVLESGVKQQLLRKADMVEKVITSVDLSDLDDDVPPNCAAINSILADFRETERNTIAATSKSKSSTSPKLDFKPQHNKKRSGVLPPVSCVCLPQGQPELLEEAIYAFLQQDYRGQKELVILNDTPDQTLVFDHPQVRIVNLTEQFHRPNQKRNVAMALCAHDLLFMWDDDGIYLPHSISFTLEKFGKWKEFFKPTKVFVLSNNRLRVPQQNIFHSGTCLTRNAFDKIRGYIFDETLYFYKEEIEAQLERKYANLVQHYDIALEDIYYIYKWGGVETFQKHVTPQFVERQGARITLNPHWKMDYPALVQDYVAGRV